MSRFSPAQKRIMKEAKELAKPTDQYAAAPLEDNIFEWHFTIQGGPDTAFQGGRYHGRIMLPAEYPMKPPDFMFLTPNGRFEVGKKICLTISAHHPESWQPSWSIRTVMLALISFLPTQSDGIGSLDYTDPERRALAAKSMSWTCPTCEVAMATALSDKCTEVKMSASEQKALDAMTKMGFAAPKPRTSSENKPTAPAAADPTPGPRATFPATPKAPATAAAPTPRAPQAPRAPLVAPPAAHSPPATKTRPRPAPPARGWGINAVIFGIVLAIAALVYRKWQKQQQLD